MSFLIPRDELEFRLGWVAFLVKGDAIPICDGGLGLITNFISVFRKLDFRPFSYFFTD